MYKNFICTFFLFYSLGCTKTFKSFYSSESNGLILSPVTQTSMNISGGVSPSSAVTFTLKNNSNINTSSIKSPSILGDSDYFEVIDDLCTNTTLSPSATCSFKVRAKSSVNINNFSSSLLVTDGLVSSNSIQLWGEADGFSVTVISSLPLLESEFINSNFVGLELSPSLAVTDTNTTSKYLPSTGSHLSDGLLGLWYLDNVNPIDNNIDVFDDEISSNMGKSITPIDASMVYDTSAIFGEAVFFDGTDDYISFGDPAEFRVTGAISISAWVKPTANQEGFIIARSNDSSTDGGYQINVDAGVSGPSLKFRINSSATVYIETPNTEELELNKWSHIVAIYVPSKSLEFYVNGSLSAIEKTSIPATQHSSTIGTELLLGLRSGHTEYYKGAVDEVGIWNRPLSPAEVRELYFRKGINDGINLGNHELPNNQFVNSDYDMTDNVLLLHMDESRLADSDPIIDYSGSNNHGQITIGMDNSEKSQSSNVFHAIEFDGADDYISIPSDASIDTLDNFTISAWVYPTSAATMTLFSKNNTSRELQIVLDSGQLSLSGCVGFSTTSACSKTANGSIKLNQWQLVTMTFDNSGSKTVELFINGINVSGQTQTAPVGTIISPTGVLNIARNTSGSQYFQGQIDELAIWTSTLSSATITQIYTAQNESYQGYLLSDVKDSEKISTTLTSVSWTPKAPYCKALPNPPAVESAYSSNNANSSLMTNLILLYHLDETSPSSYTDSSVNASTAACSNCPKPTTVGRFGGAQEFSPYLEQGINIGNSALIQSIQTGNMSFSAWIYPRSEGGESLPSSEDAHIFDKDGSSDADGYFFAIKKTSLVFKVDTDTTDLVKKTVDGVIKFNQWNHIAMTWDGSLSASNVKIFVNGSESNYEIATDGVGSYDAQAVDMVIGAGSEGGPHTMDGYLDEVSFWSRALSLSEMNSLYLRGATNIKSKLRVCSQDDCSDLNFVGHDGTVDSTFSEKNNSSVGLPNDLPTTGLSSSRYFQYIIYFETIDPDLSPKLDSFKLNGTL